LVTAGYFELSLVSVAFDTVALMLLGRKVEPIWGPAELIKFVMVRTLARLPLMRSVVLGPPRFALKRSQSTGTAQEELPVGGEQCGSVALLELGACTCAQPLTTRGSQAANGLWCYAIKR
jgi:hypothetical protein